MSSTSKSSLDHDWELETARTMSSTHLTATSDEELETISLPADPSELGDDPWEGIDEENESLSSPIEVTNRPTAHELTPLQRQRELGAEADPEDDVEATAASDLSLSEAGPSENSGTDSTFSFHFPDPLEASREYAPYPEPPVNGSEHGESDAETSSVIETDAVTPELGTSMSIGALERSATLVQPKSGGNRLSLVATSISSRFAFAAYVSYPSLWSRSWKTLTRMRFGSGIAFTAIAIACITLPAVYQRGLLSRSDMVYMKAVPDALVSTASAAKPLGAHVDSSLSALATIPACGALQSIEKSIQIPTLSDFHDLRSIESTLSPPRSFASSPSTSALVLHNSSSNVTSLSLNPIALVTSSLSTTYNSFSRIILRDLHEVLQIIDELLLFLRSHTLSDTIEYSSRSIMEFIMQKLGDRHERAKLNARKLTSKGIELMKEWRQRR